MRSPTFFFALLLQMGNKCVNTDFVQVKKIEKLDVVEKTKPQVAIEKNATIIASEPKKEIEQNVVLLKPPPKEPEKQAPKTPTAVLPPSNTSIPDFDAINTTEKTTLAIHEVFAIANDHGNKKEYEQGWQVLRVGINTYPNTEGLYNVASYFLRESKQSELASALSNASVKKWPESDESKANLAFSLNALAWEILENPSVPVSSAKYDPLSLAIKADSLIDNEWIVNLCGHSLTIHKRYKEAISKYREGIAKWPGNEQLQGNLGAAYWKLLNNATTEEDFLWIQNSLETELNSTIEKVRNTAKDVHQSWYFKFAEFFLKQKKWKEAQDVIEQGQKKYDVEGYYTRVNWYLREQQKNEEAWMHAQEYLSKYPNTKEARESAQWSANAYAWENLNMKKEEVKCNPLDIALFLKERDIGQENEWIVNMHGYSLYFNGKYDESIILFKLEIKNHPTCQPLRTNLVSNYNAIATEIQNSPTQEKYESFIKRVESDRNELSEYPTLVDSLNDVIRYASGAFVTHFANLRMFNEAEQLAKRNIEKYPQHAYLWEQRAWVLRELQRNKESLALCREALKLYPNEQTLRSAMAWASNNVVRDALDQRGLKKGCATQDDIDIIDEAISMLDDPHIRATRALCYLLFDCAQESIELYKENIRLTPNRVPKERYTVGI